MWQRTRTINKYTGEPNFVKNDSGFQCLVYQRRFGWSFTIRYDLVNGQWLQQSAGTQDYWCDAEYAQAACEQSLVEFKNLLTAKGKISKVLEMFMEYEHAHDPNRQI